MSHAVVDATVRCRLDMAYRDINAAVRCRLNMAFEDWLRARI